jgi:hypothetical protein
LRIKGVIKINSTTLMKKIFTILGFTWAAICLLIVLIMFPGLDKFSKQMAKLPFMKIHPSLSGGDVAKTIEHENYTVNIHEPVFAALIGESSRGFVQLEWIWKDSIPVPVFDSVDFNMDHKTDFIIKIDPLTDSIKILSLRNNVGEIEASARTGNGWIARIGLINEAKLE